MQAVTPELFEGVDIALFSAGGSRSKEWAPIAVERGAVVVDNSSAFRMEPDVPLVVADVNPEAARDHRGIVANPNCSTMQLMPVLKPILDTVGIERVIISTYQAVSGTGQPRSTACSTRRRRASARRRRRRPSTRTGSRST